MVTPTYYCIATPHSNLFLSEIITRIQALLSMARGRIIHVGYSSLGPIPAPTSASEIHIYILTPGRPPPLGTSLHQSRSPQTSCSDPLPIPYCTSKSVRDSETALTHLPSSNVGGGVSAQARVSAQTGLCDNSMVFGPNRLKFWANILHVWYFHKICRQGPM